MEFEITLTGTRPLLMNNARMIDPLDPIVREIKTITGKRKKTDEDQAEIGRLEHAGELYFLEGIGPYLPGENIEASLFRSAAVTKQMTALKQALFITTDANPLAYDGPRTVDGLWADENFRLRKAIKNSGGGTRTMRTRPMFRAWKTAAKGYLDTAIVSWDDFQRIAETAGYRIGVGDWRPRYGTYSVELHSLT